MTKNVEEIAERLERIEEEVARLREGGEGKIQLGTPPAGRDEIVEILKRKHGNADRIVSVATLQKRPDLPAGWNHWSLVRAWAKGAVTIDIAKVSTLMEAFSNEMRLEILYEIYKSPKYPKEITAVTGLTGGALYHHLDILTETGLITRDELGHAVLTPRGEHLADIVFAAIADIAGGRRAVETEHNLGWAIQQESESKE